jgi:hypothetical protein
MTAFWQALADGQLNAATIAIWTICAFALAMLGGALAGIWLAGKDLGAELAGMMGAMFGPTGAVPGILLGLIILALL